MKTIVIWDNCEANLKFFVVNRDVSHLDGKYVNSADCSESDSDEISNLLGFSNDSTIQPTPLQDSFPVNELFMLDDSGLEVPDRDVRVITCGFLP